MSNPRVRAVVTAIWAVFLIAVTVWAVSRSNDDTVPAASDAPSSPTHSEHQDPATVAPKDPDETRRPAPEVQVRDGGVVGDPVTLEVGVGDQVVLDVLTDQADEIHVHGYDLSLAVDADEQSRVSFVADIPGEFDIELEEQHLPIALLRVR